MLMRLSQLSRSMATPPRPPPCSQEQQANLYERIANGSEGTRVGMGLGNRMERLEKLEVSQMLGRLRH